MDYYENSQLKVNFHIPVQYSIIWVLLFSSKFLVANEALVPRVNDSIISQVNSYSEFAWGKHLIKKQRETRFRKSEKPEWL